MKGPHAFCTSAAALTLLLSSASAARAQSSEPRWEIEAYQGFAVVRRAGGGTGFLPAAGAPIATSSPVFPSRQVPSWFFGDGARLLNDVNEAFEVSARIAPLDEALHALGFDTGRGATFGFRIRRHLSSRFSIHFGVEALGTVDRVERLESAIADARSSYVDAFTALFATGPFGDVSVTTNLGTQPGAQRELLTTGGIDVKLAPRGQFTPYLVAGGGILATAGASPSYTITGHYRAIVTNATNSVPIDETDTVTIRYQQPATFIGVAGAGVRRPISARWGLRVEGRALFGPSRSRTIIDASPAVALGTPAGFIESFTSPSIQFSNDPGTGRQSSLSAPPLNGFATFRSSGIQTRFIIAVAIYSRF